MILTLNQSSLSFCTKYFGIEAEAEEKEVFLSAQSNRGESSWSIIIPDKSSQHYGSPCVPDFCFPCFESSRRRDEMLKAWEKRKQKSDTSLQ